jgi:hypothetical protein
MKYFALATTLLSTAVFAYPQANKRHDNGTYTDTTFSTSTYSTSYSPTSTPSGGYKPSETYSVPTTYQTNYSPTYKPTDTYTATQTSVNYHPTGYATDTPALCAPGQYQCHYDTAAGWGWEVCDVSYKWVNGGSCVSGDVCIYDSLNGSPYCVPTPKVIPTPETGKECYPDKYQCQYSADKGWYINSCDSTGHWKHELDCKSTETCTYSPIKGYPYCTPKATAKVCAPGTYQCKYDATKGWGWEVCSIEGQWVWGGGCRASETCSFNALNGSPYCV